MSENTTPTVLSRVKTALRITTNAFDDEIETLINSACADLEIVGVSTEVTAEVNDKPDIMQAVICYCKARFGGNDQADRWEQIYQRQKTVLKNHREYKS